MRWYLFLAATVIACQNDRLGNSSPEEPLPDPEDCDAVRAYLVANGGEALRPVRARLPVIARSGCFIAFSTCEPDVWTDVGGFQLLEEAGRCDVLLSPPEGGSYHLVAGDGEVWSPVALRADGRLIATRQTRASLEGRAEDPLDFYVVDMAGQARWFHAVPYSKALGWSLAVSPTGDRLLYGAVDFNADASDAYEIDLVEIATGGAQRITTSLVMPFNPFWSADGASIYLRAAGTLSEPDGNLHRLALSTGSAERLTDFDPPHVAVGGPVDVRSLDSERFALYVAQPNDAGGATESVHLMRYDGAVLTEVWQRVADLVQEVAISGNGKYLSYVAAGATNPFDFFVIDVESLALVASSAALGGQLKGGMSWHPTEGRALVTMLPAGAASDQEREIAWFDVGTGELQTITP